MSEYVQFGLAMALMVALLLGSYWFVLSSSSKGERQQSKESDRKAD